jgi:hypothetical protein
MPRHAFHIIAIDFGIRVHLVCPVCLAERKSQFIRVNRELTSML